MIRLPESLADKYLTHLNKHHVPIRGKSGCKKWLQYFLDFCSKYVIAGTEQEQLRTFLAKLRKKDQPPQERRKAAHAISLYFDMQRCGQCDGE